jgi:hypothetical protein
MTDYPFAILELLRVHPKIIHGYFFDFQGHSCFSKVVVEFQKLDQCLAD